MSRLGWMPMSFPPSVSARVARRDKGGRARGAMPQAIAAARDIFCNTSTRLRSNGDGYYVAGRNGPDPPCHVWHGVSHAR